MGGSIEEFHDKATKKKLRNRLSAQRARDRQKARMHLLEMEVQYLMRKNLSLMRENEMIRRFLAHNVIDGTRPVHGRGICRSHLIGRNIISCCQPHCNRPRNDTDKPNSTTEKPEAHLKDDTDKHSQNANRAIQAVGSIFSGYHLPDNSTALSPSRVIQLMHPWDRLASLPRPVHERFANTSEDGEVKPEPTCKIDRQEGESDSGDDENGLWFPKRSVGLVALPNEESCDAESSDDDSDGAAEEEFSAA